MDGFYPSHIPVYTTKEKAEETNMSEEEALDLELDYLLMDINFISEEKYRDRVERKIEKMEDVDEGRARDLFLGENID